MATKYLIQDSPNYYTYQNSTVLNLGTTAPTADTFITYGFDDATLAAMDQTFYATFTKPQLLTYVDSATTLPSASVTLPSTPEGTVVTAERTTINVNHYSGINSITATCTGTTPRFIVSFDGGTTWKSRQSGAWTTVSTANIDTLGMTEATLEALNFTTWGEIFQQTNLDIMFYMTGTDTVSDLSVDLPPNNAPVISNEKVSLASIHNESVTISARIADQENDLISYSIEINGKTVSDWVALQHGPLNVSFVAAAEMFNILPGVNTVVINAKDDIGNVTSKTLTVAHTDTKPVVSLLQADSNGFKASIGDAENDAIKYRLEFTDVDNGKTIEVVSWTNSVVMPTEINYTTDPTFIVDGNTYRYTVYYQEALGQGGSLSAEFIGEATGLLFYNPETSKVLSDTFGNPVDAADFGKFYVGQTAPAKKEIRVKNKTGYALNNIKLVVKETIANVSVTIDSAIDFTNPRTEIDFGGQTLNDGDELSFYVNVESTNGAIPKTDSFDIYAYGKVVEQ